jgi:hypothetical protein
MAAGVQNAWSTTAASNSTADTNINWAEGQAPSTVNNSSRAVMAAVAKVRKDIAGMLVTTGTSTAYSLTTNETLTLADGVTVCCRMDETNGAAPTLNVDTTGAVAIQTLQGTAVGTGELLAGGIYAFTYYASSAAWVLRQAPGTRGVLNAPTGTKMLFFATAAPTGWTKDATASGNDAAIRLVTGAVNADGGTSGFGDVFTNRTITQAMLPVVNLTHSLSVSTTLTNGTNIFRGSFNGVDVDTNDPESTAIGTSGAAPETVSLASGTVSGTVALGGSASSFGFAVKYAEAIRATKD